MSEALMLISGWLQEPRPSSMARLRTRAATTRRIHRAYATTRGLCPRGPPLELRPQTPRLDRSKVPVVSLVIGDCLPHLPDGRLDLGLSLIFSQIPPHDRLPITEPQVEGPGDHADGKQNHEDRRNGRRLQHA